jgi:hypothetical protein
MGKKKQKAKSFYGVHKGRIPGVYRDWASCEAQVKGHSNSRFQAFHTYDKASFFVETGKSPDDSGSRMQFDEWKERHFQQSRSESGPRRAGGGISAVNSVDANIKPEKGIEEQTVRIKQEPALDGSQSYFSQVPNFEPNEGADFENEFSRFASSQNLQPGSQTWRRHRVNAISRKFIIYLISLPG